MISSLVFKLLYLNLLQIFLLQLPSQVLTGYVEIPPPAAAVFLIDSTSNVTSNYNLDSTTIEKDGPKNTFESSHPDQHKVLLNDIVNTDVEVKPGGKVELECLGSSPVQWSYRGQGRPEFTTKVSLGVLNTRDVHKATLHISNANDKDAGLYICNYAEFPRIASTYHVFIPGPEIFIADSGRTVTYSSATPTVTIPCPVSVRRAKVTLRKVYFDNSLRNVDAPIATFDPRFGFRLNTKDLRDADGTYICSGYHNGALRIREYILRNEENNHTSVTFPEELQDDINPCLSYSCPGRSICRVNLNTNLPFCACSGKSSPSVTNCTRLCKTSHDCPKTEKCQFNVEKQLKMCTHVCEDHQCPEHAECYADEQKGGPKCKCKLGFRFHGNGNSNCERIPFNNDDVEGTSYCSSTKCGPNAKCQNVGGKVQCACYIGYFGIWPNCQQACTQDTDCDLQDKCSSKGVCEHVCNVNMCAPKAECKVIHRKPMCLCPPGYTGKATEACFQSHYFYSSRSGLPADSQSQSDFMETDTKTKGQLTYNNGNDEVKKNESLILSMPIEEKGISNSPSSSTPFPR